jgi:uncharacterized protein YjbI with pentapeptide repeats
MKDGKYLLDGDKQKIPESPVMGEQRQSVELALRAILTHAHKNNVKRDDIIFEGLDIRRFNLSNITCQLTGVIFRAVLADEVNFQETTLENAHFIRGDFQEARFCKATLNGAEFGDTTGNYYPTNLREAKFTNAELNMAKFHNCDLYKTRFQRAELKKAVIYILKRITEQNVLTPRDTFTFRMQRCKAPISVFQNLMQLTSEELNWSARISPAQI